MPAALPPTPPAEIIVTGQGLAAVAGDAAYDVVTIDRDRLTSTASGRLEDVLRDVAGFNQFRRSDARSAHPTSQGATLRGLGGNASSRALVVLDGVPQIDPFGGWVTFTAFDPSRLGQVRVTRGGGSGIYGPGALAGTIELQSAGPEQLAPVQASLLYGSRNSIDADAALAAKLGAGFATLSASYSRGDGFIPIIASQRGPVDKPAPYRQGSINGRVVFPVAPDTELQANMLLLRDERTRGLDGTDNTSTGADASMRLVGRGRWGFEALAYVQARKFTSGFASASGVGRTIVTKTLDQYDVPATGIGGRFEIRPPLGAIELRLGVDARRTVGETDEYFTYVAGQPTRQREAGGATATTGAFADVSVPLGDAVILTGGGRVDRWWITNGRLRERTIANIGLRHQHRLCRPQRHRGHRARRPLVEDRAGAAAAHRRLPRLAAADAERALPPVPRGRRRDRRQPGAQARAGQGHRRRGSTGARCRASTWPRPRSTMCSTMRSATSRSAPAPAPSPASASSRRAACSASAATSMRCDRTASSWKAM
jgi:vitamin B12 transporter